MICFIKCRHYVTPFHHFIISTNISLLRDWGHLFQPLRLRVFFASLRETIHAAFAPLRPLRETILLSLNAVTTWLHSAALLFLPKLRRYATKQPGHNYPLPIANYMLPLAWNNSAFPKCRHYVTPFRSFIISTKITSLRDWGHHIALRREKNAYKMIGKRARPLIS